MLVTIKKLKYIFIVIVALSIIGYGFYNDSKDDIPKAEAAAAANVTGFAWSQNVGWISFNSLNCDLDDDGLSEGVAADGGVDGCPALNSNISAYGVNLDASDFLSGFAWSENIGWISFNWPDIADSVGNECPSGSGAGTCRARLSGLEFLGWARACSVFSAGCSGALKASNQRGGWDGWISLSCNNGGAGVCAASNYKVSKTGNDFGGFGWSDLVVGWISFNCLDAGTCGTSDYKVHLIGGNPILTLNPTPPIDYCRANLPGAVSLSWQFDDVRDGFGNQTAYQIKLTRIEDGKLCDSGIKTSPPVILSLNGTDINGFNAGCADFIDYGGYTYSWKLRVFDSDGNINSGGDAEGYKTGDDFPDDEGQPGLLNPTPNHIYPIANFSVDPTAGWLELSPITFDPFFDPSGPFGPIYGLPTRSFSAGGVINELEWDFDITDGTTDIIENPVIAPYSPITHQVEKTYVVLDDYTIDLKVTDSDGNTCWAHDRGNQKTVTIGSNKPKWNEAAPE